MINVLTFKNDTLLFTRYLMLLPVVVRPEDKLNLSIATQMATDLQLDEQSRNRIQQVYYNRAARINDWEK